MGLACLSCSAQFPDLVGLARARDNINNAANQSAVVKPHFSKIGLLVGLAYLSCSAQFPYPVHLARP